MPNTQIPRILVVDDDLGVIASYRFVLNADENRIGFRDPKAVAALEGELFGRPAARGERQPGWRVGFVDCGEDAVAAVRRGLADGDAIDVIFLDMRMGEDMDGYDTARAIRVLDREVQIVVVSAYSDYTEDDLLEVAGPADRLSFLPKPVWPEHLHTKAVELCSRAAAIRGNGIARISRRVVA